MKNPVFRMIFFIYLGVLLIAILIATGILWKKLSEYQEKYEQNEFTRERIEDEKRSPQLAFEKYTEEITSKDLASIWISDHPGTFETQETVTAYYEGLIASGEDGLEYFKDDSYTDEIPVFKASVGDVDVYRVTLSGRGVNWEVSETALFAEGEESVDVTVPEGFTVKCNGKALDEKNITKSKIVCFPYDSEREKYGYDQLMQGEVFLNEYHVGELLCTPEITIVDRNGNELPFAEGSGYFIYPDEETVRSVEEWSLAFLKSYLNYYIYGKAGIDEHLAAAQSYTFPGSPAWNALINAYEDSVSWAYGHSNLRNELISVHKPVMWADNLCTIDITYHAYAMRNGRELDYSRQDERIRMILVDYGYGYRIYAFDVSPKGEYGEEETLETQE